MFVLWGFVVPLITSKPIGLIVSGSYFVLPHDADAPLLAEEYINTIKRMATPSSLSSRRGHSHTPASNYSTSTAKGDKHSHVERGAYELGGTEDSVVYAKIIQTVAHMLEIDLAQIYPGSIFGLDHYFIRNFAGRRPIVMVSDAGDVTGGIGRLVTRASIFVLLVRWTRSHRLFGIRHVTLLVSL